MALTKKRQQLRLTGYERRRLAHWRASRSSKPIDVYTDRIAERVDEPSLAAELGTLLEEPIAAARATNRPAPGFEMRHVAALAANVCTAIATPDRLAFEAKRSTRAHVHTVEECEGAVRNVQIKTASMFSRADWGEDGTDGIPDTYLAQVQWRWRNRCACYRCAGALRQGGSSPSSRAIQSAAF